MTRFNKVILIGNLTKPGSESARITIDKDPENAA